MHTGGCSQTVNKVPEHPGNIKAADRDKREHTVIGSMLRPGRRNGSSSKRGRREICCLLLATTVTATTPAARLAAQDPAPATPSPAPRTAATPETTALEPTPPPAVIRGPVTKVPNAATLVVADRRIRLSGIDPGPFAALGSFESWLHGQGALLCEPDAQTGRYRCFTSNGVDVAEAAILNGAGRVGDGAMPSYRARESEARQARRGLWQGP
jgi:endonuclease YncB( thermonuclease family)